MAPKSSAGDAQPNQVRCPTCGRVRMETPPGTTALPTLGMARKAAGALGDCGCGRRSSAPPAPTSDAGTTPDPGTVPSSER